MNRYARVRKLYEDGTALVVRADNCITGCHQCGGCTGKTESLIAQNPEGAKPGELVRLCSHPGKVVLAALMLYILPVAAFFAGYWAGKRWWNAGPAVGCVAIALGAGGALVYDRKVASKPGSGYTITKI